jgi:hypothetical protein
MMVQGLLRFLRRGARSVPRFWAFCDPQLRRFAVPLFDYRSKP